MDAFMASSTTPANEFKIWDFKVINNEVPMIIGDQADQQAASLAAFFNLDACPQLPGTGVPWTGFFTGTNIFADVDAAIRNNLQTIGLPNYQPVYSLINDQVFVTLKKGGTNS